MSMPISSVSAGVGIAPMPEYTRTQARVAQQHAVMEQFAASLPGSEGQSNSPRDLKQVTADIEQVGLTFNKKLEFVVDHKSQEVIVKVIDKETNRVVKVLPPEELQRLHRKLRETIGFLFNERV